jgi:hypothetical protein
LEWHIIVPWYFVVINVILLSTDYDGPYKCGTCSTAPTYAVISGPRKNGYINETRTFKCQYTCHEVPVVCNGKDHWDYDAGLKTSQNCKGRCEKGKKHTFVSIVSTWFKFKM